MSYVDPGTFSSTNLPSAAMNVIADDIRYLKSTSDLAAFTGVSLLRTTAQSISTSSYTAVSWGSAPVMVGGTWWTSGSAITVPTGTVASGYTYAVLEIFMLLKYDVNGTNSRGALVKLAGSTVENGMYTTALASDTTVVPLTVWALAQDGQALEGDAWQSSGSSLNLTYASMHIKRLGCV